MVIRVDTLLFMFLGVCKIKINKIIKIRKFNLTIETISVQRWYEFPKEYAKSTIREGLTDLPIESATWLGHFKIQNKHLLDTLDVSKINLIT